MAQPSPADGEAVPEPVDAEVEELIAKAGGDPRRAVRSLLDALAALRAVPSRRVCRGDGYGRLTGALDALRLP